MNGWQPVSTPPIILATTSPLWSAWLLRQFKPRYRIVRAADIADAIEQSRTCVGAVAIVEVVSDQVPGVCEKLLAAVNGPHETCWMAVGDRLSDSAIAGLRHAGFQSVCTQINALPTMLTTVDLALESAYRPLRTIEEQVQNGFFIGVVG